jgi:hypothetical protein
MSQVSAAFSKSQQISAWGIFTGADVPSETANNQNEHFSTCSKKFSGKIYEAQTEPSVTASNSISQTVVKYASVVEI